MSSEHKHISASTRTWFNWKDGLPQAHDTGFLPETGLSRQSGSLNLHRFDSRKVVSWITCLSSFCIPAIFPRSHKWLPQSAVILGSTGMLNTQLPAWQELLPHHPDVAEVLHCHSCAHLQLLAGQIIMGWAWGCLSSLYLANGASVSHQQGQCFPNGLKWASLQECELPIPLVLGVVQISKFESRIWP